MKKYYDDWYDHAVVMEKIEQKTNGTCSISEVLRANAKSYPFNTFINSFGRKITWRTADERINRLASSLKGIGLDRGVRVTLLCSDCDKFVLTYLAIIRAGGVTVPINTRLATTFSEIEYIVNHSQSKIFVLEDKFNHVLENIKDRLLCLHKIVVIGEKPAPGAVLWSDLLESGSADYQPVSAGGDEQALQLYTSGTTGRPKGAMLSHNNCLAQMEQMSHAAGFAPDDLVQNMLPFPHCGFIALCLSALYAGAGINIIYPFDPETCAGFVEKHKTTVLTFVPAMAFMLLRFNRISDYDFSSVRMFLYGSAPMSHKIIVEMKKLWPWVKLMNIYGMTECAAAISTMKDQEALSKIGGVGRAVPGGEIRVVNESGEDAGVNEIGEIIYRGPNVMTGYFNNPEGVKKVLKDGWYYTGDLGVFDEDGILKVVDRSKDMLIRGGENVYPAEVERALFEEPSVEDCAVIGVYDERLGERTKAFVVVKNGYTISPRQIIEHCKKELALFKVPEVIEFVDKIPRTPMEKIDKVKLRAFSRDNEWRVWEHR